MPIIVFILTITVLFFVLKYKIIKNKNKELEKKLERITEKEIVNVDLNSSDKKFFQKIFNKKIKYLSFIKKIKYYEFIYSRGDFFFGGKNENYDVVKIRLKKIKINGEPLFNIDVFAWEDKLSFEREEKPDKQIIEVLTKKEMFKQQVLLTLDNFFVSIKEKETKEITIDNE